MKCPDCGFVCSDLRDICPKCLVDLRDFKEQTGLRVSNPRASYEQLVDRATKGTGSGAFLVSQPSKSIETENSERAPGKTLVGFLSGFFSRARSSSVSSPTPSESPAPSSSEVRAPIAPESEKESDLEVVAAQERGFLQSHPDLGESPSTAPFDAPQAETSSEALFSESSRSPSFENTEVAPAPRPPHSSPVFEAPPISYDEPHAELAIPSNELEFQAQAFLHDTSSIDSAVPQPETPSQQSSRPEIQEEQAPTSGETIAASFSPGLDEISAAAEIFQASATPNNDEPDTKTSPAVEPSYQSNENISVPPGLQAPSEISTSDTDTRLAALSPTAALESSAMHEFSFSTETIETSIEQLFGDALQELTTNDQTQDLELSAEHFFSMQGRSDVEVLFEMSREALIDPESERRYVNTVQTSVNREVDAGDAAIQLRVVERLSNAQLVSLKGNQGLSISGRRVEDEIEHPSLQARAPAWRRISAFGLDALVALLCGLGVAIVALLAGPFSVNELVTGTRAFSPFDLIDVAMWVTLGSLVNLILLPFISLSLTSRTLGQLIMGLMIRSPRGRPIGLSQALVWCLTTPLSIVSGGALLVAFGRSSLHEWASKALVVAVEPSSA